MGGASGGGGAAGSSGGTGGAAAAGGTAGSAGAGAGGAAGRGGSVGRFVCVDVSQVDDRQRDDLRVIGTGFDAYEGQVIRIVVTHGEPTYGLGDAPIVGGSFDIGLPGVLGDYTGIAVYVDTVRDDACNPEEEILWQAVTGPAPGDTVWQVTPDSLMVFDQAGPCNLNGVFDLTASLPCPLEGSAGLWALVDGELIGAGDADGAYQDNVTNLPTFTMEMPLPYPQLRVSIQWSDEVVAPGTFSGNDVNRFPLIGLQAGDFESQGAWYSNREGGTSLVTVTAAGTRVGERVVGTFSGTLAAQGDPTNVVQVTQGRFDVPIRVAR